MKNVNEQLAEIAAIATANGRTVLIGDLTSTDCLSQQATALFIERSRFAVVVTGVSAMGERAQMALPLSLRAMGALTFVDGSAPPLPSEQDQLDRLRAFAAGS